ncbi:MAG: TIGR03936 family radical SAM-associated protein [Acidobacteriota bacterium]
MPPIRHEDLTAALSSVDKPARYTGGELHSVVKDLSGIPIKVALAFPDTYEIGMSHLGLKILYGLLNRRDDVAAERVYCPWPDMEREMRARSIPLYTLETHTPVREFDVMGFSLQHELCYTNILTMLELAGIPLRTVERRPADPLIIAGGPVAFCPEPIAEFIDLFLIGDGEEAFPLLLGEHLRLSRALPPGTPQRREKILRSLARIQGVYVPSLYEVALDSGSGLQYVCGPRPGIPARPPLGAGKPVHPAKQARNRAGTESGLTQIKSKTEGQPGLGSGPVAEGPGRGAGAQPGETALIASSDLPPGEEPVPFPVRRAIVWDLERYPFPTDIIVPFTEVVHDRVSVEITRGCVEGCRFCQAGIIYRPVRERNTDSIVRSLIGGLEATGHDEASLVSLSDADYSCFPNLVEKVMDLLEPRGVALGLSSLRVYGLTDEVTEQIARVKKTGFTIAPEAGTQRLRDAINKGIRDEDIDKAAYTVFRSGWARVKLYFMIGQPTETEEDVIGIARTGQRVIALGRRAKKEVRERARAAGLPVPEDAQRGPSVHLSASSFIPKPHSTFQWARMNAPEELRAKQALMRRSLKDRGIKFKHHEVEESLLECVLSRGDRRLGRVIERAWKNGARFDSWSEHFRLERWLEALAAEGLGIELFTREIPLEARLPWDHVDTMVDKQYLLNDYRKALQTRFAPACMRPVKLEDGRVPKPETIVCYNCGVVCDLEKIKQDKHDIYEGVLSTPGDLLPPPAIEPGAERWRYRLSFRKRGMMIYLSHLDLVRTFTRALRRAGLPLRLTQGFSPRPEVAFGPALALGVESRAEFLEFNTVRAVDPASTLRALAATLPADLGVWALVPVAPRAPSLTAVIGGALYTVEIPLQEENGERSLALSPGAFPSAGAASRLSVEDAGRAFERFVSRSEAFVVRRKKDREVRVEVRGAILLLEVERRESSLRVRLGLRMGPQGAVKPVEVLEAALGAPPASFRLRRDDLLVAEGERWVSPLRGADADVDRLALLGDEAPPAQELLLQAPGESAVEALSQPC